MGKNDTRLFTKIRNEFNNWGTVLTKGFSEGESRVPSRTGILG